MRMRNAVSAAVGALVIAAALAGPASAAEGTFTYLYPGSADDVAVAIENPADERCYNFTKLPEGQLPVMVANDTSMIALVYTEKGCKGEAVELAPGDSQAADDLVAKSVVFVADTAETPSAKPDRPAQPVDEAQPGDEAQPAEEAEEAQPAEEAEPAEEAQPAEEAEPAEPAEEAQEEQAEPELLPADGDRVAAPVTAPAAAPVAAAPAGARVDRVVEGFLQTWG